MIKVIINWRHMQRPSIFLSILLLGCIPPPILLQICPHVPTESPVFVKFTLQVGGYEREGKEKGESIYKERESAE